VREPESSPNTNTEWVSPTEPDILLNNFKDAVTKINIVNYERCFDQMNFSFKPDPIVEGNNLGVFENWTLNEESEYFKNLDSKKGGTTSNNLIFINTLPFNYLTVDSLEYTTDYKLTLIHKDTIFNNNYNNNDVEGKLIFILTRTNYEWMINFWRDIKDTTLCWTDLKANFITQ
ncbi:MAG: hypothetical protein IIA88_07165, partial [Bacteroidetes bacterium]|nr:hypothetical protein [Bacteroidota bacterium]